MRRLTKRIPVLDSWARSYEILGNSDPALHAHIVPRYRAEPDEYARGPVRFYPWDSAPKFHPLKHKALMEKIGAAIEKRMAT